MDDAQFKDDEILLYDLGERPASYDFVTCLSTAMTHGVKHVRFVYGKWKPKDYTLKQAEERWQSIVRPTVALYGIEYSIGKPRGIAYSHFLHKTVQAYEKFGRIQKIPVAIDRKEYVTVTLRCSRTSERDSNEAEWLKFAARCDRKVIIIRDWDERPIAIEDRMKLYANAYMNLMVINGPLTLCIHSDAPYISMRTIGGANSGSTSPAHMDRIGITPGFQFPWSNDNQHLSYLDDTCENIEAEYLAIQERMKKRMVA